MELSEKLQHLRKQKGFTQEELAESLYVSRTAISKWESGRGYPSIDSLKAISKLFSVSIDELLSGEELFVLAENEQVEKTKDIHNLVFGILDCMLALLFFLPFFGQQEDGFIKMVSLLSFNDTKDFIWLTFAMIILLTTIYGVAQLALQNWRNRIWAKSRTVISIMLNVCALMLTIASRHPYPGAFLLCILVLKGILLWKQP